jgi:hypothetical protein
MPVAATHQFFVRLLLLRCEILVGGDGSRPQLLLLLFCSICVKLGAPRHVMEIAVGVDGEDVDEGGEHEDVLEEVEDDSEDVRVHDGGREEDADGGTTEELQEQRRQAAGAMLAAAMQDFHAIILTTISGQIWICPHTAVFHRRTPRAESLAVRVGVGARKLIMRRRRGRGCGRRVVRGERSERERRDERGERVRMFIALHEPMSLLIYLIAGGEILWCICTCVIPA